MSGIPITAQWDLISLKVAAGGFRVEALHQFHEDKGFLPTQGYIFDAIQQFGDYSARVHNILCNLPEFDDDEDGQVNRADNVVSVQCTQNPSTLKSRERDVA